ncbi:ribonuclease HII [Psychrobacter sp. M13]|uniref:ribonuclease HII n=1 Tax=Psychrobacter sp. M13 TaxID=3067275 RepID=UPI00273C5DF8|nr:ribonuclease HII [Psychrobacter sp. M13]WLP95555.1 ribonuclease HII [Psychrobacter sp. M13]
MSYYSSLDKAVICIETTIERIDVKGQHLSLAAPIYIRGELKAADLCNELQSFTQDLAQAPLQIGIDEAGRGPLLGSVNVASALLPSAWSGLIEDKPLQDTPLSILTDSKQLSEKKRDILYPLVQQHALGYVIADIPAAIIDQINILQATMLGMRLCTEILLEAIAPYVTNDAKSASESVSIEVLYDGNRCPELNYDKLAQAGIERANIDSQAWVRGDARHTSIAAASILAKVSRDKAMYALDANHPQYNIAKHKGYPTRAHIQAIDDYGVLEAHRRSFGPVAKKLAKNKNV